MIPHKETVMFHDWSQSEIDAYQTQNFTFNNHSFAISPERFESD
jgi:hypothetical protein